MMSKDKVSWVKIGEMGIETRIHKVTSNRSRIVITTKERGVIGRQEFLARELQRARILHTQLVRSVRKVT